MSAPTDRHVGDARQRLAAHTMRDGECPVCEVPHRCRPWADAFADLIAHGELPETTPAHPSGGEPTAGQSEGETR
ncbi:hypothetical protein JNW88_08265 [Micromonospora sp. ATA32]|nr:hypothetical protein [Micromonospora sp. ATA32]